MLLCSQAEGTAPAAAAAGATAGFHGSKLQRHLNKINGRFEIYTI